MRRFKTFIGNVAASFRLHVLTTGILLNLMTGEIWPQVPGLLHQVFSGDAKQRWTSVLVLVLFTVSIPTQVLMGVALAVLAMAWVAIVFLQSLRAKGSLTGAIGEVIQETHNVWRLKRRNLLARHPEAAHRLEVRLLRSTIANVPTVTRSRSRL